MQGTDIKKTFGKVNDEHEPYLHVCVELWDPVFCYFLFVAHIHFACSHTEGKRKKKTHQLNKGLEMNCLMKQNNKKKINQIISQGQHNISLYNYAPRLGDFKCHRKLLYCLYICLKPVGPSMLPWGTPCSLARCWSSRQSADRLITWKDVYCSEIKFKPQISSSPSLMMRRFAPICSF